MDEGESTPKLHQPIVNKAVPTLCGGMDATAFKKISYYLKAITLTVPYEYQSQLLLDNFGTSQFSIKNIFKTPLLLKLSLGHYWFEQPSLRN